MGQCKLQQLGQFRQSVTTRFPLRVVEEGRAAAGGTEYRVAGGPFPSDNRFCADHQRKTETYGGDRQTRVSRSVISAAKTGVRCRHDVERTGDRLCQGRGGGCSITGRVLTFTSSQSQFWIRNMQMEETREIQSGLTCS